MGVGIFSRLICSTTGLFSAYMPCDGDLYLENQHQVIKFGGGRLLVEPSAPL